MLELRLFQKLKLWFWFWAIFCFDISSSTLHCRAATKQTYVTISSSVPDWATSNQASFHAHCISAYRGCPYTRELTTSIIKFEWLNELMISLNTNWTENKQRHSTLTCLSLFVSSAKWSPWGRWGTCSVTCGGGRRIRRRTCVRTSLTIQCTGRPVEVQKCGKSPCPGTLRTCCKRCHIFVLISLC